MRSKDRHHARSKDTVRSKDKNEVRTNEVRTGIKLSAQRSGEEYMDGLIDSHQVNQYFGISLAAPVAGDAGGNPVIG